jgi:hypothetical protein
MKLPPKNKSGWHNDSHRHYLAAKYGAAYSKKTSTYPLFATHLNIDARDMKVGERKKVTIMPVDDNTYKEPSVKKQFNENVQYFNEMAEVKTDAAEVKEVSKDMEEEYVKMGMTPLAAKFEVKKALEKSKAYEHALFTSDDPDEFMAKKKQMEDDSIPYSGSSSLNKGFEVIAAQDGKVLADKGQVLVADKSTGEMHWAGPFKENKKLQHVLHESKETIHKEHEEHETPHQEMAEHKPKGWLDAAWLK